MSAKPSSLPPITVTSPAVLTTQPASLVPAVTPFPPPMTTASDVTVPIAAQMSELMAQATTDATE
ncbi:MAG TPA: hypothetical protein VNU19_00515 [Candidatus Acidoferrum sp.]|jgi:hypothetical protein|nr:hypothetical protein [Candidatus Acidoferrum sp.]